MHYSVWAATWQNQQNECAPSKDSDQPGHTPSLIRVFAVGMKKAWVLSYTSSTQRRLWSDWADAQADLSLCWAHVHFVGFVMSRLSLLYGKNPLQFISNECALDLSVISGKPKSIPKFSNGKKAFKKCNTPDFKFYLSKLHSKLTLHYMGNFFII